MNQRDVIRLLSEVAETISSQGYLEQGLHEIVEAARKLFGCRTIAVILTDPESEYLKVKTSRGLSKAFVDCFARKVGTGVLGDTIWAGRTLLLEDAQPSDPEYKELKLELEFKSAMCAPLIAQSRPLGYIYCDSNKVGAFDSDDLLYLRSLANLAALAANKHRLYSLNRRLCRLDERTLILRFEAFYEELEKELRRAQRYRESISLLLLDIDNFKEWKDLYGTESTAKLLEDVVYVVRNCVRGMDIIGKYGVDEIIICSPKADKKGAGRLAERICEFVINYEFEHEQPETTVSIGVATTEGKHRDPKSLMETVRTALLNAQRMEGCKVYAM